MAIAGCPFCIMCNAGDKAGEVSTSTLGFDIEDHCVNLFSRFHIGKMEIYLFKKIIMTSGITSVKRLFIVYQLGGFVRGCRLSRSNSFINIFKGFAKSVSYLALRFSKLLTTFFKKYLLHSQHTMSLQCYKTSIRWQDIA